MCVCGVVCEWLVDCWLCIVECGFVVVDGCCCVG